MKQEDRSKLKQWEFICSYTGIIISGVGIYMIMMLIYLLIMYIRGDRNLISHVCLFPGVFLKWTFPVIVFQTAFLLASNISLIIHEGFAPRRLLGTAAGIACIALNIFARYFLFSAVIVCYLECYYIGIAVMSIAATMHRPGLNNDFLIILGCAIGKDGRLLPLIKNRVNRAIRFAWEQEIATGKPVCYLPTGGQGPDESMSEGDAMSVYLLSHSAESYEVMTEMESRNTYENFLYSKQIVDETKPGARVVFVTTNYHVLRSGMLAKKAGLNAEGLSSTTKWYFWPNGFVRETMAILILNKRAQIIAFAVCLLLTVLIYIGIL